MGDSNAARIKPLLLYWGAMSTEQAAYFLKRFYSVDNADAVVNYLCTSRYIAYLRGRHDVVCISDYPGILFNDKKERCIWVFFEYAKAILRKTGKWPKIVSHNEYYGVNFKYDDEKDDKCEKKYYSMVYVGSDDYTYYPILKTQYDEATTYIYVTDDKKSAEQIKKINTKDKIWYVQKIGDKWDIVQYMGKTDS